MCKKYFLLGIVFILIIVNCSNSLSIKNSTDTENLTNHNDTSDVVRQYKNNLSTLFTDTVAMIERYAEDYPCIPKAIIINQNWMNLHELFNHIKTNLFK